MPQQIQFADFRLDPENELLFRGDEPIGLRPKAFSLLLYLASRPGELATKEDLLDALWPGVHVSDAVLKVAVGELRRALGDSPRTPELIETAHRRGYRFIASSALVEAERVTPTDPDETPSIVDVPSRAQGDSDASSSSDPRAERSKPSLSTVTDSENVRPSDFVGRQAALDGLEKAWQAALRREDGRVLITGAAGIGKTRLLAEFEQRIESDSVTRLIARSTDRDGVPGFWLWQQILGSLAADPKLSDAMRPLMTRAEWNHLVPGRGPANGDSIVTETRLGEDQAISLFDAATSALRACAEICPLLLILEDLQWAGERSLKLLDHIVCEVRDVPLLIVATIRDETQRNDRAVARTAALMRQQERSSHLKLEGLSISEIEALYQAIMGRPASSSLAATLFDRTEGIPFFLGEAIRFFAESDDGNDGESIDLEASLPPRTVDLLNRSLESLTPECRLILGAGAVLGRDFSLTQAANIAEFAREDALDAFDEAIRAGVVQELSTTVASYRFSHALFQEAIYDELSAGRRARLHQRAAQRLESQHAPALEGVFAELSHHLYRGIAVGDPEHCYAVATRAAAFAEQQLDYEQAAENYGQALEALSHCDVIEPARRLSAWLSLGNAHRLSGEHRRAREAFEHAIEAARSLGASLELARAAIGYCNIVEFAAHEVQGRKHVDEALAVLGEAHLTERARLTARLAYLSLDTQGEAEAFGTTALQLARESADPTALQEALYALNYVRGEKAEQVAESELLNELVEAARACSNRDPATLSTLHAAFKWLSVGDLEKSSARVHLARELAGDSLSMRWYLAVWDTGLAIMNGRFDEVESRAVNALSLGQRIEHPIAKGIYQGHLAQAAREQGDPEELVRRLEPGLAGRIGATGWLRAAVARADLQAGRETRARQIFEEFAASGFESLIGDDRWEGTIPEIALLCAELGDRDRAPALLEILARGQGRHAVFAAVVNYGGPYRRCEAKLRGLLGESLAAVELYEEALVEAQQVGARPMSVRIQLELSPLLFEVGEGNRARVMLSEAQNEATQMGLTAFEREIEQLLVEQP